MSSRSKELVYGQEAAYIKDVIFLRDPDTSREDSEDTVRRSVSLEDYLRKPLRELVRPDEWGMRVLKKGGWEIQTMDGSTTAVHAESSATIYIDPQILATQEEVAAQLRSGNINQDGTDPAIDPLIPHIFDPGVGGILRTRTGRVELSRDIDGKIYTSSRQESVR